MTQRMDHGGVTPAPCRDKDVIIRDASIISPIEIERALLSHPLVRDAAVFGAPDPVLGQRVAAVVQLEGGDDVAIDNILAAVTEQLADYKVPELLVAVDAVPRNPLGKIDRQALAKLVLGVPAQRHLELLAPGKENTRQRGELPSSDVAHRIECSQREVIAVTPALDYVYSMLHYFRLLLTCIAKSDRVGIAAMRIAIAIVFLWIGALKFAPYEADSITPFVANSPVMSFFYKYPSEYKAHLTREGELNPADRSWQTANGTYAFSRGLGTVELAIGFLTLVGLVSPRWGFIGATLAFLTPFVTLSFLLTTPEAWVPALGDAEHGFPYLSGAGRLAIKDVLLLAGGWLVLADSSRALLAAWRPPMESS
jgi:uncharacterized membrane protein YkgB